MCANDECGLCVSVFRHVQTALYWVRDVHPSCGCITSIHREVKCFESASKSEGRT